MKRDILYVDDEMENLVVFQATFEDHFNVFLAESGAKALEMLAERSFPVVVADQRMPKMSGAELFEILRRKYPHTKRIMLTGYADPRAMLSAINQGQVFYFIKKPWEQEVVFSILFRAIEAYDMSLSNLMLQDRLVAADRCAMLGRSAARLAHEMGNQLCMLPLLELIEDEYSDQEDLMQMAAFARSTHERLVEIINEVKAFVRFEREEMVTGPLALSEVVHELVEFLRYEQSVPADRLSVQIESDPRVRANRVKLQQVLINMLKNAQFAIRDCPEGRITLSVSADENHAVIVVADNGCGMSPDVAERIWEPFFTTKGDEGTGLGLDVAKSIIEGHGGTIACQTAPGAGATFTIRLPILESTSGGESRPANPGAAALPVEHAAIESQMHVW
ncbi:MAG: hybrid sensor histidine kinase/response regulator [Planctomycetota bacterium]|nr:MAG: hybrid sensor histidine kinase/response regulator [Planctomycetota bacterium]